VAEDVSETVAAEINDHADRYPGAKIIKLSRRTYPDGTLAAHVLGHLGAVDAVEAASRRFDPRTSMRQRGETPRLLPDDRIGRMGVERQYETSLRGHSGTAVERRDHSGRILASFHSLEPVAGNDVQLTLDPTLQRTAEELLRSALERRAIMAGTTESAGGAIVAMEINSGAIRAAASAPAFDPNVFAGGDSKKIEALLTDKSHPLLNRVCNMALPPGSTFKTVTAAALLASATIGPEERYFCRGYLHQPDRQRCEIYIRQNVGHGEVTLADALCRSCNVFFFHFAGQMGPKPLGDWAERFGFGRPTGIDLPGEASGTLPSPESIGRLEGHAWHTVDTQSMAVGQGSLTATPLQVLCMMAAVANGGRLVQPHVAEENEGRKGEGGRGKDTAEALLSPRTLQVIRDGLRRVVADPQGTAHGTVYLESTAIAGKTGTAETGEGQTGHAWFAGYAPAEHPTMAFVVVLEHAGDAATTAGPLAKRLILRMEQLGML
jgi:penicillin-binding protein 2